MRERRWVRVAAPSAFLSDSPARPVYDYAIRQYPAERARTGLRPAVFARSPSADLNLWYNTCA